jgi:DNA repair protein REV1
LFCLKAALLQADDYLNTLPIKVLPGIGFTVSAKLKSNQVEYCGQLRKISKVCQRLA